MSDPYLMTLPWERENSDTPRADKIIREYLDKGDRNAEDTERDLHAPMQRLERELKALSSEITPSDEQLNALFNYYRLYVIDKAPAPDLKSLHERQRAAWDAVFGVRP